MPSVLASAFAYNASQQIQGCAKDQADSPILQSIAYYLCILQFLWSPTSLFGCNIRKYILQMFAVLYLVFHYVPNVPLVF